MSEGNNKIETPREQAAMEPALVLLINNETGDFEWQDIPAPEGKGVKTGGSWEYKILCAAHMELQQRLIVLAQNLWITKMKRFGKLPGGSGIEKAGSDILKKLDERGMNRR